MLLLSPLLLLPLNRMIQLGASCLAQTTIHCYIQTVKLWPVAAFLTNQFEVLLSPHAVGKHKPQCVTLDITINYELHQATNNGLNLHMEKEEGWAEGRREHHTSDRSPLHTTVVLCGKAGHWLEYQTNTSALKAHLDGPWPVSLLALATSEVVLRIIWGGNYICQ